MSGVEFHLLDLGSEEQSLGSLGLILFCDPRNNGNALDQALLQQLIEQLEAWRSLSLRAIVVRSRSDIAFSVGMDFAAFQAESAKRSTKESTKGNTTGNTTGTEQKNAADLYCKCLDLIYHFPAPVICLLEKPAKAGGVGLLMAADLILATKEADMTLGEALFGLIPANVLPYLRKRISERRANQMVFQPQALGADTLFAWGLIDMPPAEDSVALQKYLKNALRSILRCSPVALESQKHFQAQLQNLSFDEQQQLAQETLTQHLNSQEVRNGINAFQEGSLGPWSAKLPKSLWDYLS